MQREQQPAAVVAAEATVEDVRLPDVPAAQSCRPAMRRRCLLRQAVAQQPDLWPGLCSCSLHRGAACVAWLCLGGHAAAGWWDAHAPHPGLHRTDGQCSAPEQALLPVRPPRAGLRQASELNAPKMGCTRGRLRHSRARSRKLTHGQEIPALALPEALLCTFFEDRGNRDSNAEPARHEGSTDGITMWSLAEMERV